MSQAPLRIGPYEVVRELGRGGMGAVYEVRHPETPRRLALKVILGDAAAPDVARFLREAELLAKVRHPNVVLFHSLSRTDRGQPYLVTDLVEGESLKTVARCEAMAPARAVAITRKLALAVAELHAQGILHRDLKPENVILGADDEPVLLDFGLARDADARTLTKTGDVLGTPAYMSPEQASGEKTALLDARTDVYGLGAILFELLAGRAPFEGTAIQIVAAVLAKEPRWPSASRDDVPRPIEAVLRRCLSKTREARPASAVELAAELEAALAPPAAASRAVPVVGLVAAAVVALGATFVATRGNGAPTPPVPIAPSPPTAPPQPAPSSRPSPPRPVAAAIDYRARVLRLARADCPPEEREPLAVAIAARRADPAPLVRVPLTRPSGKVEVRFLSDSLVALADLSQDVSIVDLGDATPVARVAWRGQSADNRVWGLGTGRPRPDGARPVVFTIGGAIHAEEHHPGPPTTPSPSRPLTTFDVTYFYSGKNVLMLPHVAFARDGDRVAIAGWGPSVFFHRRDGDRWVQEDAVHSATAPVTGLAFCRNDQRVLVATASDVSADTRSWLILRDGKNDVAVDRHDTAFEALAVARDGNAFAAARGRIVKTTLLVQLGLEKDALEPKDVGTPSLDDVALRDINGLVFGASGPPYVLYGIAAPHQRGASGISAVPPAIFVARVEAGPRLTTIRIWRRAPSESPTSIDVSPDGTLLAVGGSFDGRPVVEIWPAGD